MSAPVIFEDAYYERLRRVEQDHGWFRGLRGVGFTMLRAVGAERAGVFVDAGCGTGAVLEAARVLRRGGILYLRTMRWHSPNPGTRRGDPHYHQYSLAEVAALCEHAGLRVERLTTVNILPALKGRMRQPQSAGGPGIPDTSPREPLNTVLRLLLDIEGRVLARTGWRCELGLSIVCVARKGQ